MPREQRAEIILTGRGQFERRDGVLRRIGPSGAARPPRYRTGSRLLRRRVNLKKYRESIEKYNKEVDKYEKDLKAFNEAHKKYITKDNKFLVRGRDPEATRRLTEERYAIYSTAYSRLKQREQDLKIHQSGLARTEKLAKQDPFTKSVLRQESQQLRFKKKLAKIEKAIPQPVRKALEIVGTGPKQRYVSRKALEVGYDIGSEITGVTERLGISAGRQIRQRPVETAFVAADILIPSARVYRGTKALRRLERKGIGLAAYTKQVKPRAITALGEIRAPFELKKLGRQFESIAVAGRTGRRGITPVAGVSVVEAKKGFDIGRQLGLTRKEKFFGITKQFPERGRAGITAQFGIARRADKFTKVVGISVVPRKLGRRQYDIPFFGLFTPTKKITTQIGRGQILQLRKPISRVKALQISEQQVSQVVAPLTKTKLSPFLPPARVIERTKVSPTLKQFSTVLPISQTQISKIGLLAKTKQKARTIQKRRIVAKSLFGVTQLPTQKSGLLPALKTKQLQRQSVALRQMQTLKMPSLAPIVPTAPMTPPSYIRVKPILPSSKKRREARKKVKRDMFGFGRYTPSLTAVVGGITTRRKVTPRTTGLEIRPIPSGKVTGGMFKVGRKKR